MKLTLKAARVNAGFTQQGVAAIIGKNTMTVANWENGKTPIKVKDLMQLCEIYGVSIKHIFLPV